MPPKKTPENFFNSLTPEQRQSFFLQMQEEQKQKEDEEKKQKEIERQKKLQEEAEKLKSLQQEHMKEIHTAIEKYAGAINEEEDCLLPYQFTKEQIEELILSFNPLPTGKKKKTKKGATAKPVKEENPNEIYTGPPCCLARDRNSYCGYSGGWLCEKHLPVYQKHKKMRNGWFGCLGDNCCEKEAYGSKHSKWIENKPYYQMDTADNRPEECKKLYPIESEEEEEESEQGETEEESEEE
jgi:hypothetical protein